MTSPGSSAGPWEAETPERIADRYYDATTWIYRLAWGSSFHFAPLRRGEARTAALRRYEDEMANALDIRSSSRCLDLGCGVGGPATTIATSTGARIVALNANLTQLGVMRRTGRRLRHATLHAVGGDFGALPFRTCSLDRAYAFEALCHAGDLQRTFREIHRVLRPDGMLGFSEWSLTEAFVADDESHRALRRTIERSYGVARLRTWPEWEAALTAAGFRVVRTADGAQADRGAAEHEPWYRALLPRDATLDSLGRLRGVRLVQAAALALAERLRLVPRGTRETVGVLRAGTAALVEAGRLGIFTPMRFALASKHGDA